MRIDGRAGNELRPISITPHYIKHAEGSVLIEAGATKVICTATVEDRVPTFLKGQGKGWITAEYAMLPRATQVRNPRESMKGRPSGRTMEIQRLIGRALRPVVDLDALGEKSVTIDCDVIQADGGTRTTSITGSFVALALAMQKLVDEKKLDKLPIIDYVASVSVGIVDGEACLDLCYEEDSGAKVDMNVVMTGDGRFVEVQGTGEESPFSRQQLEELLALADSGIRSLIEVQRKTLGPIGERIGRQSPCG